MSQPGHLTVELEYMLASASRLLSADATAPSPSGGSDYPEWARHDTAAVARNAIIECHMPLARSLSFRRYGLDRTDAMSVACESLVKSAKSFDPAVGARFAAHASASVKWTLGERAWEDKLQVSGFKSGQARTLMARIRAAEKAGACPADALAIAAASIGLSLDTASAMVTALDARFDSLDAPASGENGGESLGSSIADGTDFATEVEDKLDLEKRRRWISEALDKVDAAADTPAKRLRAERTRIAFGAYFMGEGEDGGQATIKDFALALEKQTGQRVSVQRCQIVAKDSMSAVLSELAAAGAIDPGAVAEIADCAARRNRRHRTCSQERIAA